MTAPERPTPATPRPGDLDEKGIADLRKVFPRAIARIEAAARQRVVEQISEELTHFDLSDDPGYIRVPTERVRAILVPLHDEGSRDAD